MTKQFLMCRPLNLIPTHKIGNKLNYFYKSYTEYVILFITIIKDILFI